MLATACSTSSLNCIQFFVRTIYGKSLVLHAKPNDTIRSIHGKILSATGIPLSKQRLIYDGKQLQWEYTLFQYNITNDSTLHLVARIQSTQDPCIENLLYAIRALCKGTGLTRDKLALIRFVTIFPHIVTKLVSFASIYPDNMFVSSCVPEALVELYISPHKGNKKCARKFIKDFITSCKKGLQNSVYHELCAPIVLQFCKLLCTAATNDDPLYKFCRNILISMLDYLKNSSIIAVQDIFPFVDELATKLSQGLVSSMESIGPSSTDVHDFNKFFQFMMNEFIDPMVFDTLLPMHYYNNHPGYGHHQIGYLYSLYLNLLAKLQACLTKMGDDIKVIRKLKQDGGWDQYLPILKQLHYISQLYEGAEETFWTIMRPNKAALCYLVIRYAKRGDEHYNWILNHKDLTDFESRRHLVMMLVPEVTQDYENGHKMLINRSSLLAESFASITGANLSRLHHPVSIGFTSEEATGAGVLREWFMLVCQAIFNPQNALFLACPTDRRRFFPNPASKVNPLHLEYFKFAGRVIALSLVHKMQVGIVFGRAFFLQLAGIHVSLEDIKDADPYLYSSCKQILEMDPCVVDQDVLGLTFTWEVEELGVKKVVELRPNGKQISVNSINRNEYIDLIIEHQFVKLVAQQVSQFSQGFVDIVGNEENKNLFIKSLEHEDLDGMLRGSESEISVDDWKAHTKYIGYKETDHQTKLPDHTSLTSRRREEPFADVQIGYLYSLYLNLLAKLQACLTKMGDDIKVIRKLKQDGGWDQYLPILKQLHYISQLYEGAEETFWTIMRPNKAALCYLVIRYAKRGDEHYNWILNHKDLTDFESRRHLVMMLVPEVTQDYENGHKMLINRSSLLAESFASITGANLSRLHHPVSIGFTSEEATGAGVLREWFMLVCQAIFNPQNALFLACPTDRRRFFPNPASKVNPLHLEYFKFAGRVIALSLVHKMQVGIVFGRAFFLQLAGIHVSLEDIKDADPYLYSSCKQILEMDPCVVDQDVLGLTFTWEVEELGVKKVVELRPNGKQISVNSINRNEYIDLIIEHQFVKLVAQQVSQFSQGFVDIVGNEENKNLFIKSLEHEDLDGMLRGSESEISVDDWKAHTKYIGYKETDHQVCWFWKIIRRMSVEQRKVLLFFWTSVKYLPVEGFCGLASRLSIIKSDEKYERLPSSHTCFYQICFPAYPSKAIMQKHLEIITQEHVGCSFGTR